jgi:hypothetical protein
MADDFLNRYVGIVKESSYGTDPTSGYIYGEVDEESLGHKFDLMVREDMSRAISSKAVTGKEYSEGDINLAMQVDDFVATCLLGFFPTDSVSGSGPYTHNLNRLLLLMNTLLILSRLVVSKSNTPSPVCALTH